MYICYLLHSRTSCFGRPGFHDYIVFKSLNSLKTPLGYPINNFIWKLKQRHLAKSIQGLKSSSTEDPCTLCFLPNKNLRDIPKLHQDQGIAYTHWFRNMRNVGVRSINGKKHRASPIVHALAGENMCRKLATKRGEDITKKASHGQIKRDIFESRLKYRCRYCHCSTNSLVGS